MLQIAPKQAIALHKFLPLKKKNASVRKRFSFVYNHIPKNTALWNGAVFFFIT